MSTHPIDAWLAFARNCSASLRRARSNDVSQCLDHSAFAFIQDDIYAILLSHVQIVSELGNVLNQSWVREWGGWQEANSILELTDSDAERHRIATEFAQSFCKIVLQNSDLPRKSDSMRRAELKTEGKIIGRGDVHGNNECCADAVLQALAPPPQPHV